jgi:hypothetical protein
MQSSLRAIALISLTQSDACLSVALLTLRAFPSAFRFDC